VAATTAPAGGSQGTGQDLGAAADGVPVRFLGTRPVVAGVGGGSGAGA
jgi:hypothetical protein